MYRVLRDGSILIATAILTACAAQREEQPSPTPHRRIEAQGVAQEDGQPPRVSLDDQAEAAAIEQPAQAPAEAVMTEEITAARARKAQKIAPPAPVASVLPQAAAPCCMQPYQGATITERYAHMDDNPVRLAAEQPVSTFSIDVDTGAYANVRRFLNDGRLPPQDAVRVEEMVNYFDYEYAPPADRETPFRVSTELAPAPWNAHSLLLKIGLKGFEVPAARRPPANLVFLIDVSGSMQSPDKLPLLQKSFNLLTEQLTARDRVAIVVYAGSSGVVLEPTAGNRKHDIREAIERLQAGGSTNGAAGIARAYQLAHESHLPGGINHVVLATDGDFNVGVVNFEALVDLAERERASGIALTTLGFGSGNYNDQLLERLADAGNGNYAYVDSLAEARKVLVSELSSTLFTIAKDVKIQVEFNPAAVLEYRLIGYENRVLAREDFNNDNVDAGEIGAGHRVTALYEIVPVGERGQLDPLRYGAHPAAGTAPLPPGRAQEIAHVRVRYKGRDAAASQLLEHTVTKASVVTSTGTSADFRFAASVAAFGQLLRGGKYLGEFGYEDIAALARGALDRDTEGYRREFVSLVESAARLVSIGLCPTSKDETLRPGATRVQGCTPPPQVASERRWAR